eukprot:6281648-Alexandrium_andersonii.AAC.1
MPVAEQRLLLNRVRARLTCSNDCATWLAGDFNCSVPADLAWRVGEASGHCRREGVAVLFLSLIHISEPTRLALI